MARTRIKICGIRDADTAWAAAEAGADAVGLVLVSRSARCVTVDAAVRIAAALPPWVEPVGVFVDTAPDSIRQIAQQVGLRTVQLHGDEPLEVAAALAPLRVIRAFRFTAKELTGALGVWQGTCPNLAGILLDSPPVNAAARAQGLTGGSGQTLDWDALAALWQQGAFRGRGLPPLVLAGGLTPDNVGQAITTVRPYGVDVSSGVESSRGVKDVARIRAFCDAVREADATL